MPNRTTENARRPAARRRTKKPADWRSIALGTVASFLAIFTLLAARMQSGQDPAIGPPSANQTAQAVIHRRLIVKRKVIHETIVPASSSASSAGGSGNAPSTTSAPAPSPPPSYSSAPAPTYYPPAPAPVTRAS